MNMDPLATYNEEQWELMLSALQGELSAEERIRFEQWLAASAENREGYERLERLWREGLAAYPDYLAANVGVAWEDMQRRFGERRFGAGAPIVPGRRTFAMGPWLAVAAIVVLLAGTGWWFFSSKNAVGEYVTSRGETKDLALPDGTKVLLDTATRVEVVDGYAKGVRTVRLLRGKAVFTVAHLADRPFRVETDAVRVEDIGTRFVVEKTVDSVRVAVMEGRVAFVQIKTGQSRQLGAGDSLSVYTGKDSMLFTNAPVAEVLAALEKHSGKRIVLSDTTLAGKKLNVNLNGESLENSLRVICASLNLEYTFKGGVYVLAKKK
jgi:transmembrane sensor